LEQGISRPRILNEYATISTMPSVFAMVVFGMLQGGISYVVFGAVAFSIVMCLVLTLTRGDGSMYDQIGQGGLSRDSEASTWTSAPAPSSPAEREEQEREIRQMLSARSTRLVNRGQPALDIDAEVARLLAPQPEAHDAGLTDEVRQLVSARNERRERRGLQPLDVEAEVARTLAELNP
jgi:hypothetical protein